MQTLTVFPHMCETQKHEIEELLQAADGIGAAATSVAARGGQGYDTLLEARSHFKNLLESQHKHYRVCIESE